LDRMGLKGVLYYMGFTLGYISRTIYNLF